MTNIYIKPATNVGPNTFGLYMLDNGVVNVANFSEATRHPYYGNMMGWKNAVERYVVTSASLEDVKSSTPVFSIGYDEERESIQFVKAENEAARLCPIFPSVVQKEKETTFEGFDYFVPAFEEKAKQRKRAL